MDIVLALLMAYVLGGAVWPQLVRSRQFYLLGFAGVLLAMVLQAPAQSIPLFILARLVEAAAFVLLVLAASGGSLNELWREFRR